MSVVFDLEGRDDAASPRSRSDALDAQAIFDSYDEDGDGKLTSTEAIKAVRALGHCMPQKAAVDLETDIDCDYAGEVDFTQFNTFLDNVDVPRITSRMLFKAFASLDDNNDGKISRKTLQRYLGNLGEPLDDDEMKDFMQSAVLTNDKQVDIRKFVEKMSGKTRRRLSLFKGPADASA